MGRRTAEVFRDAYGHYIAHHGGTAAWAIAFRSLLCLVPLLLLVGSLAAFVVRSSREVVEAVTETLTAMLPMPAPEIERGLRALVVGRAASGFLGFVGYLWMASGVFHLLYDSFNLAAGVRHGFIRGRLVGLALCLLVTLLLAAGFGMTSILGILGLSAGHRGIEHLGFWPSQVDVRHGALSLLVAGLCFAALYKFLPARRVAFRWALISGLGMGAIWQISRWGFSTFVSHRTIYGSVYGSVAGVVLAGFWAYLTSVLLIYGAEFTFSLDRIGTGGPPPTAQDEIGGLPIERPAEEVRDATFVVDERTPCWPASVPFERKLYRSMDGGDGCDVSFIVCDSHLGTHIDAPAHFLPGGATLEQFPADLWWGPCRVLDMTGRSSISAADLAGVDFGGFERILFLTDNTRRWAESLSSSRRNGIPAPPEAEPQGEGRFFEDFVYLESDAAQVLVDRGVRLVGTDALSTDPFHAEGHPAHQILLGAGVAILEGLNLQDIHSGDYEVAALPPRIRGTEASPSRVLLRSPLRGE